MPIFDNEILFLHIPRTGGSIIENKLKKIYNIDLFGGDETIGLSEQHFTANEIMRRRINIHKLFSFTFVRNPFDRILSTYLNGIMNHTKSFDDYIDTIKNVVEKKLYYTIVSIDSSDLSHYKPQFELLENLTPDFIGRFENYENDIKILSNMHPKLNCLCEVNIKKRNVDYKKYYNERNRKIIEELYKDDLKTFNYEF